MRKLAATIAVFCLTINLSQAQYYTTPIGTGNPNDRNTEDLEYPVGGGLPGSWNCIHIGNTINPAWTSVQNVPFNFNFNGNPVSTFKVSTSGILTFNTNALTPPSSTNVALPSNSIPNNSICIWGLSAKGINDKIVTKTFGTAPNRQFWISFNDYSKQNIFTSHYTYWSIVLEESTNNIYVMDQRTSTGLSTELTIGVQISNTQAYSISGSPILNSLSTGDPTRADNRYYTFIPGTQPNRDIKGLHVLMSEIVALNNAPFAVKFICQNTGSDTITSFNLNYSNYSTSTTTNTISNLNILPWQTDTIEHPQSWLPVVGSTTLFVWASNINNDVDENTSNDTASHVVTFIQQSATRVPLLESFTSSTSPKSSAFNDSLEHALDIQTAPVVHVKYAMNWPGTGDPYYTVEAGARRQVYAITTLPNLQIDGSDWSNFNYSVNTSTISTARNKMAIIDLDAEFYVSGQTVCTDITIDPLVNINNPNLKLYVAIYEKQTINNTKSSGESKFYHVMKKMLPNSNGSEINYLVSGVQQQENFCYTFKGSYILPPNANSPVNLGTNHTIEDFSDLGVAAWLQDDVTKEVLQAAEAFSTIELAENDLNPFNLILYPNPTKETVFISLNINGTENLEVELTNLSGQVLLREDFNKQSGEIAIPLSLPHLSPGLYIINIEIGQKKLSKKLIIQ